MATTVWKGHLTFGLVSIPVKLYRAARPEKVSFRQLQASTGVRVRQALVAESPPPEPEIDEEEDAPPASAAAARRVPEPERFTASAPVRAMPTPARERTPEPAPRPEPKPRHEEVQRSELVKGYEYARDQYVTLTREELASITPQTAREMQILEFVQLAEVDPIHYETSYYAAPDRGGERAYSLLFAALRQSGFVGVAQVAMHNREHIVLIRPGRSGLVLHTMYYESEIRREDEYRADTSAVGQKELDLALLLIRNLAAPFEPAKYRDTYREKLEALIQAKIAGDKTIEAPRAAPPPVVNILDALERSLAISRKPAAAEEAASPATRKRKRGK